MESHKNLARDFTYALDLQEEIEVQAKDGYLMVSHPQCGWWCVPPSPTGISHLQTVVVEHIQLHLKHLREQTGDENGPPSGT